jgi:hypothetical protein
MPDAQRFLWLLAASAVVLMRGALAQTASPSASAPIAIVPVEGVKLTGTLNMVEGKANLDTGGTISAGLHAATITLPHRGNLRLCATSKVTLTADSSIASSLPLGEEPGLMMALDRGALEANFSTGQNSDVILTPDFRIVISGPGTASVQVRLGPGGDTCVDNRGPNAPYVSVSSIFDGGLYRVRSDQRVLFEGGSLSAVVDTEKEPCGCPPETPAPSGSLNDFPLAQSEGLAPPPPPRANAAAPGVVGAQATVQLSYDGNKAGQATPGEANAGATASVKIPEPVTPPAPVPKPESKPGFFGKVGHFFRKLFGG